MSNILQKICEDKSKELEETKKRCSFKTLEKLISSKLEKREFKEKLLSAQKNKKNFNLYNLDANTFLKNCKKKFDIIFLFEFLEHLEEGDKHKLFESLIKILNKNALIFVSTLNKNLLSKYLAIDIAENILKLLPKKTHEYDLFLSPTQLQTLSQKYKLSLLNIEGLQYNPIIKSFKLSKVDLVNYIGALKY